MNRVTANQIVQWAATRKAHAELPRLLRSLVHASGDITSVWFPAGDSVHRPGIDGEVTCRQGNAWLPQGASVWELSCNSSSGAKANDDYAKRDAVSNATYVAVTARKWSNKAKWAAGKRAERLWADVRAYDADDLEAWLEQFPAVALGFAEKLGMSGEGVESPESFWQSWASQSDPAITMDGLFAGRGDFIESLHDILKQTASPAISLQADSAEEAVAMASAAVMLNPKLSTTTVVVTGDSGWRFVEQSPHIRVVIAANQEVARRPKLPEGGVLLAPRGLDDRGLTERRAVGKSEITIQRPRYGVFQGALRDLGLDNSEARRIAHSTGRSWTVFRRQYATNPAIRRPAWLEHERSDVLSTLVLLSAWKGDRQGDHEVVAEVAGCGYEDVERVLLEFAAMDDPPVLKIGDVWKAKAPLELLDLYATRIPEAAFSRFFTLAEKILAAPDPVLDLEDKDRFAANLYGKERVQSGYLVSSICAQLVKLAVRAPEGSDLPRRVPQFVHALLLDADATRWLSLASHLSTLAEAAPEAFLEAVELSLKYKEPAVERLLLETGADSLFGRCWHADLLWALEMLAWSRDYLVRTALILIRLAEVPMRSSWSNTPLASLIDIFLPWRPHTTATVDERLELLDILYEQSPDIAYNLCVDLMEAEMTSGTHKPKWRDWDKAATRDITVSDVHRTRYLLLQKALLWSSANPARLARLVDNYAHLLPEDQEKLVAHLGALTPSEVLDPGLELLKASLRRLVHFEYNYSMGDSRIQRADMLSSLLATLQPQNPIVRHHWLFADSWVELPERNDIHDEDDRLLSYRKAALLEVYQAQGWSGIKELVNAPGLWTHQVGWVFGTLDISYGPILPYILDAAERLDDDVAWTHFVTGFLRSPGAVEQGVLKHIAEKVAEVGWAPEQIACLLNAGLIEPLTWDLAMGLGSEVDKAYWRTCKIHYAKLEEDDLNYALRRLLDAERPRSAHELCSFQVRDTSPELLLEILEGIASGKEEEGAKIDGYHIAKMLQRLERSEEIDELRLLRMEFMYFEAVDHIRKEPTFLERKIASEPNLFVACIGYLYKPAGPLEADPFAERNKMAARSALSLLQAIRILPGIQDDGSIDPVAFNTFYENAIALADAIGRREVCESQLGEWFAHAPADPDGKWPCAPVREVLNRAEAKNVCAGFRVGVINARGMTSRGLTEGGEQERNLAAQYRNYADILSIRETYVKQVLLSIAESYECDAFREDTDARLWEDRL